MEFIFGLGSGRCGTGTLADLLNKQKGICCFHEGGFCPWEKDLIAFYQTIVDLVNKATEMRIGNVAFYWKNYLSEIFRDFNNPKVIVLKRAKEKVVESFSSMYYDKNHWSTVGGKNWEGRDPNESPLTVMFPKYDLCKKDAISKYWEEYYNDGAIDYYLNKFPENIMLIRSEDLWKGEHAQKRIFEFLEIPKSDMVFDASIWKHKRREEAPVVKIDKPIPEEFKNTELNYALYGQAVDYAGLNKEVEMVVSDEEMAQIMAHPNIKKMLCNQKS